jgi:hypothetical protein
MRLSEGDNVVTMTRIEKDEEIEQSVAEAEANAPTEAPTPVEKGSFDDGASDTPTEA